MPFGSQSCEDRLFFQDKQGFLAESPMPFGSQSCEDYDKAKGRVEVGASPMPFGSQSCEDLHRPSCILHRPSGHQCLSAVSPVRTGFKNGERFFSLFSHQCLSAVSPVRTGPVGRKV